MTGSLSVCLHILLPLLASIQNTVGQPIELQGNRCSTGKSSHNSRGTGIAKFAVAAPLMTVQLTEDTGVAQVPPAKVMSPWSGGTGMAKFSGASPLMTVQLTAILGAVLSKVVPPAEVVPPQRHHLARGFILLNKPPCEGLARVGSLGTPWPTSVPLNIPAK